MPENAEYEVGYKKPPAHSRWKPGQSGNPRGRPKRERNFERLFDAQLDQRVQIKEQGNVRAATLREVIIKRLVTDAAQGDVSARRMILPILMKQQTIETFEPDPEDRAAFEQLMAEHRLESGSAGASEDGDV